ncbi:MAG: class I SAM-dependent methyltransferase, partial [Bacteroidota bacterium]
MSIYDYLLEHFRKPKGFFGGMVARKMNESHAGMTEWGFRFIDIPHNARALDIGCGGGATVERLAGHAPNGKITGIDYSQKAVKTSSKHNREFIKSGRVTIGQASVSSMPFEDDSFDIITAVETCFFWPDPPSDFREVLRVLRPGGTFLVLTGTYK